MLTTQSPHISNARASFEKMDYVNTINELNKAVLEDGKRNNDGKKFISIELGFLKISIFEIGMRHFEKGELNKAKEVFSAFLDRSESSCAAYAIECIKYINKILNDNQSREAKAYKVFLKGRKHFLDFKFTDEEGSLQKVISCYMEAIAKCNDNVFFMYYFYCGEVYRLYALCLQAKEADASESDKSILKLESALAKERALFYYDKIPFQVIVSRMDGCLIHIMSALSEDSLVLNETIYEAAQHLRTMITHELYAKEAQHDFDYRSSQILKSAALAHQASPQSWMILIQIIFTYHRLALSCDDLDKEKKYYSIILDYCNKVLEIKTIGTIFLMKGIALFILDRDFEALEALYLGMQLNYSEKRFLTFPDLINQVTEVFCKIQIILARRGVFPLKETLVNLKDQQNKVKPALQYGDECLVYSSVLKHLGNIVSACQLTRNAEHLFCFSMWLNYHSNQPDDLSSYLEFHIEFLRNQMLECKEANRHQIFYLPILAKKIAAASGELKPVLEEKLKDLGDVLKIDVKPKEIKAIPKNYKFVDLFRKFNLEIKLGKLQDSLASYNHFLIVINKRLSLLLEYAPDKISNKVFATTKDKLKDKVKLAEDKKDGSSPSRIMQDKLSAINSLLLSKDIVNAEKQLLEVMVLLQSLSIKNISLKDFSVFQKLINQFFIEKVKFITEPKPQEEVKSIDVVHKTATEEVKVSRNHKAKLELIIAKRKAKKEARAKRISKAKAFKINQQESKKLNQAENKQINQNKPKIDIESVTPKINYKTKQVMQLLQKLNDQGANAYVVGGFVCELLHPKKLKTDVDITFGVPSHVDPLALIKKAFPDAEITSYDIEQKQQTSTSFYKVKLTPTESIDLWHSKAICHSKLSDSEALIVDAYGVDSDEAKNIFKRNQFTEEEIKKLEDVSGREFTMNTVYLNAQGAYLDPTGRGLDDLRKNQLVAISSVDEMFVKHPLRAFRAIYLCSKRKIKLPENFISAIKNIPAQKLDELMKKNPGRVNAWLRKILLTGNGAVNFQLMLNLGFFHKLFPEMTDKLKEHGLIIAFIKRSLQIADSMVNKVCEEKESKEQRKTPIPKLERVYMVFIFALFIMKKHKKINLRKHNDNLSGQQIRMLTKWSYLSNEELDFASLKSAAMLHNLFGQRLSSIDDFRGEVILRNIKKEWNSYFAPNKILPSEWKNESMRKRMMPLQESVPVQAMLFKTMLFKTKRQTSSGLSLTDNVRRPKKK